MFWGLIAIVRRRITIFFALLLCATISARADNDWEGHILSFMWENDATAGSDRHYTQGARISYLSRDDAMPEWLMRFANWFPDFGFEPEARKFGFAVAQELYTPEDLQRATLIRDDRPYAGWLYGTATIQRRGPMKFGLPVMENFKLDVGIIGPEAFGEETQKAWHGVAPQGWHNQLNTEPGINLRYDRSVLYRPGLDSTPWHVDIIPSLQGSAGNVLSFFGIGSTLRFGYNTPNEFEVPLQKTETKFGAYLFLMAEGRVVLRNIFLDGNTFTDSHHVDKRYYVGDARAGITVVLKHVELTAAHTVVSQEFKGQKSLDSYGTATVTFKF